MADCYSFLVLGLGPQDKEKLKFNVEGVDVGLVPAQREMASDRNETLGKDSRLASPADPKAPISESLEFVGGVLTVKGKQVFRRVGGLEFPTFAAAQGWLNSADGKYFVARMENVFIIATHACGPVVADGSFKTKT